LYIHGGHVQIGEPAQIRPRDSVKFCLTDGQVLCLLCIGRRRNLSAFDQFNQRRIHMTNEILITRLAQALLAVAATGASLLVVQFALLSV
jgi:hypothetical protein